MELMAAAQGVDLLRPLRSSPVIEKMIKVVRRKVPRLEVDRVFHDDMTALEALIASGELAPLFKECFGGK